MILISLFLCGRRLTLAFGRCTFLFLFLLIQTLNSDCLTFVYRFT